MALNDNKEFRDEEVKKNLDGQLDYYEENEPDFEYEMEDPVKEDKVTEENS